MSNQPEPLCDETQFDAFFRQHAKGLHNYLFYKFGDPKEAEDVVQDSFVTLWKNCAKVTLETAKSYLYTVATNLGTSIKRREQVKFRYEQRAVHLEHTDESPEYLILENEFMEKLNNAISGLSEKQREAFLLNRVDKKTYKEIAEIMEVSQKAIEKLMHKALLKLRKEIDQL